MKNPAIRVGRTVAGITAAAPRNVRPPRPYTRGAPARGIVPSPVRGTNPIPEFAPGSRHPPPVTQTPTTTGTGVTTTSGGFLPGAPASGDLPDIYKPPVVKNWGKATAAQLAQAALAPQYASLYQEQHQAELMAGQQQAAITSYGLDLAKILGTAGPGGQMPTLGPNYAASLTAANQRNFAYQQFLYQTKVADDHAKIAAQYPTLLNQFRAQQEGEKLKWAAFNFQKLVAGQAYHLNLAKTQAYNKATNARLTQSGQRIQQSGQRLNLSRQQYNLSVAKAQRSADQWNAEQATKANTIDLEKSKAAGQWVNAQGQSITNVPFKNPPPPYYKPTKGNKKAAGGITPYQKTEIFDGAVTLATHLNDTRDITKNPGGHAVGGREAYRRVRFYLKARYPNLKTGQLNQLTQAALVSGGYPKAPRHF